MFWVEIWVLVYENDNLLGLPGEVKWERRSVMLISGYP
jgi:hypothetical protein